MDRFRSHVPPALSVSTSLSGHSTGLSTPISQFTSSPRVVQGHTSHLSSHLFEASSSHRQSFLPSFDSADPQYANVAGLKPHYPPPLQHSTTASSASSYPGAEPSPNVQSDWESVQSSPHVDISEEYTLASQPMDIVTSPMAQEFPARSSAEPDAMHNGVPYDVSAPHSKLHKTPSLPPRKQRWHVLGGMFGNSDKSHLPPVDESHVAFQSQSTTPSLKRTQSSSTDSRSLPEVPSPTAAAPTPKDHKKIKKEAARMVREAEMQRRVQMQKAQQEQSRAVMENRNQIIKESQTRQEIEWKWQSHGHLANSQDTSRLGGPEHSKLRNGAGPIRDRPLHGNAVLGLGPYERMSKARKREFDDDHSMSSSDVRNSAVVSVMSFATNDSDHGHSLRARPSMFSSFREPPASSPLGHFDDFSNSGTSDQSVSHHHTEVSMDSSSLSDLGSPPPIPIHTLSLSPAGSWQTLHQSGDSTDEIVQQPRPSRLTLPSPSSDLRYGGHVSGISPSPDFTAPKSACNPIFNVVSFFLGLLCGGLLMLTPPWFS